MTLCQKHSCEACNRERFEKLDEKVRRVLLLELAIVYQKLQQLKVEHTGETPSSKTNP